MSKRLGLWHEVDSSGGCPLFLNECLHQRLSFFYMASVSSIILNNLWGNTLKTMGAVPSPKKQESHAWVNLRF
jgi:hypothetical protein